MLQQLPNEICSVNSSQHGISKVQGVNEKYSVKREVAEKDQ
jgi:hypothetical protein